MGILGIFLLPEEILPDLNLEGVEDRALDNIVFLLKFIVLSFIIDISELVLADFMFTIINEVFQILVPLESLPLSFNRVVANSLSDFSFGKVTEYFEFRQDDMEIILEPKHLMIHFFQKFTNFLINWVIFRHSRLHPSDQQWP